MNLAQKKSFCKELFLEVKLFICSMLEAFSKVDIKLGA